MGPKNTHTDPIILLQNTAVSEFGDRMNPKFAAAQTVTAVVSRAKTLCSVDFGAVDSAHAPRRAELKYVNRGSTKL